MFLISDAATQEIQRLMAESECLEPVASFGQRSKSSLASKRMIKAIEEGDAKAIFTIAKQEYAEIQHDLDFQLAVFVHERAECLASNLCSIAGIEFNVPLPLLKAMAGLTLDHGMDGFVFRAKDGSIVSLAQQREG